MCPVVVCGELLRPVYTLRLRQLRRRLFAASDDAAVPHGSRRQRGLFLLLSASSQGVHQNSTSVRRRHCFKSSRRGGSD